MMDKETAKALLDAAVDEYGTAYIPDIGVRYFGWGDDPYRQHCTVYYALACDDYDSTWHRFNTGYKDERDKYAALNVNGRFFSKFEKEPL